ncbi:hypothetical protein JJB09_17735 [Rhizobium sp. KVB221]|uniref:Uncharacterized protein n=1 Tax=Rhizobium setariae TaxID=2801340 RepID=A0A937CQG5_9HYPH|nr:hypothetical protein [Rhizobium setariae]MBL0373868.1 hypothetical protein [Rhizobium setariae]
MSEFQNRAVELLVAGPGAAVAMDTVERRTRFLENALELYRAMGGTLDEAGGLAKAIYSRPATDVVAEIGDVMIALAGISQINDVDMMQAAYNTLDAEWKNLELSSDGSGDDKLYSRTGASLSG